MMPIEIVILKFIPIISSFHLIVIMDVCIIIYIQLSTDTCVSIKCSVNHLSIILRFCIPMGNSRPGLAASYHIYVVVNNHISKIATVSNMYIYDK